MKYPYIYIASAYALGALLAPFMNIFLIVIPISVAVIRLIIGLVKGKRSFYVPLVCVCFILGMILYTYNSTFQTSLAYRFNDKYVTLEGYVSELPKKKADSNTYSYVVKTNSIKYDGEIYYIKEKIQVSTIEQYQGGDIIVASGFLSQFSESTNDGGFDFQQFFKVNNVKFKLYSYTGYNNLAQSSVPMYNIDGVRLWYKTKMIEVIDKFFVGDNRTILRLVLTDYKSELDTNLNKMLIQSGALRFLQTSSLQVWLCILYFILIMNISSTYPNVRRSIIVMILIFAMLFYQDKPTFIKWAVIFIVYQLYIKRYGFLYVPDAFPLAIFLLTLFKPLFLSHNGFILSTISGILYYTFYPYVLPYFSFINNYSLRKSVCVWFVLFLGLFPFCAYYTHGISIYTFVFSILFIPILIMIISLAPLMLITYSIFNTIPFFYESIYFLTSCVTWIIKLVYNLPFSYITVKTPSILALCLWSMILILLFLYFKKSIHTLTAKIIGTFVLVFSCILFYNYVSWIGDMEVNFVNVGQGDATIISVSNKEKILIDGGGAESYSNYNIGDNVFVPYLRHKGFSRIDIAIATHYHKDHSEGIVSALENMRVRRLIIPDCEPDNEYRILLEETARNHKTEIIYAQENMKITYKSGLSLTFLSPDEELLNAGDSNEASIVVDVSYGDFSMLLTGDIGHIAEESILKRHILEPYDILHVPHHGSRNSSSVDFIKATLPKCAIISVGEDNSYGLPAVETTNTLNKYGTRILRTDQKGDITVRVNKKGIKRIQYFKDGDSHE